MSTSDSSGIAPPAEVQGQLSQLVDPGGGIAPLLAPTPLPGAMATSSPGLTLGAATPPVAPTLPGVNDPMALLSLLSRMAGELFSGASVSPVLSPVPLAPGSLATAGATQPPPSPGIAPVLVPAAPAAPSAGAPSGTIPYAAATGDLGAPALSGGPSILPSGSGGTSSASGAPWLGPTAVPAGASSFAPSTVPGGYSAAAVPGGPAFAPSLPGGSSFSPSAPGGYTPSAGGGSSIAPSAGGGSTIAPSGGGTSAARPVAGASPAAPSTAGYPAAMSSPFTSSSFDPLPQFGIGQPGAAMHADVLRLPVLDGPAFDAAPYFLPEADVRGLETDAAGARALGYDHELPSEQSPLVRNLGGAGFDPYTIRRDFPILEERVHGKRLVWLDNAATTQKPRAVIDRLSYYYEHENSNVHRAAHTLAARATDAFENARESVRRALNAPSSGDIVWVRGATEGINLVAQSWGRRHVGPGDEIVITWLEHHANIVPWQQLCADKGARLRVAPVDDRGDVILEEYEKLLGPRTRIVAFSQVSNALGTVTPAREMVEIAHRYGARVLVDGAQAISHMRVDVQLLDCDFYVFSGHKVFAPTGIGVVYGKRDVLETMPPWQGGGNMIQDVTFERTTYQPPPGRFEAGTGSIADAIGLGAALDYLAQIGIDNVDRYEHELLVYATERLRTVPGLHMIGTALHKAGVLSFVLDGQRTEDVGAALDKEGIAVRSGHHCAQPILRRFGLEASVRASLAFYNVCEDIDALVDALWRLQGMRR